MPSTDPSSTTPHHPDIPPFPSPSTFSILPDLYILLVRLAPLRQQQPPTAQTSTETEPSTSISLSNEPAVNIKDLPALIYPVKQKILKAKAAVQALPDIERSITEQEAEMRVLEGRVRGLRARLGDLGEIAGRRKGEGGVLGGTTGAAEEEEGKGMVGVEIRG